MRVYLIILEDGEVYKTETVSKDDLAAVDMGIVDVINCEDMTQYFMDAWREIDNISEFDES